MPQLTVHILLATYNGGDFLAEQLSSIAHQTHTDWTLTVSENGSTDNTLDIVAKFADQVSQPVTVLTGPCQGSSTRNFFHLIRRKKRRFRCEDLTQNGAKSAMTGISRTKTAGFEKASPTSFASFPRENGVFGQVLTIWKSPRII